MLVPSDESPFKDISFNDIPYAEYLHRINSVDKSKNISLQLSCWNSVQKRILNHKDYMNK